jgi:hypothetical protein
MAHARHNNVSCCQSVAAAWHTTVEQGVGVCYHPADRSQKQHLGSSLVHSRGPLHPIECGINWQVIPACESGTPEVHEQLGLCKVLHFVSVQAVQRGSCVPDALQPAVDGSHEVIASYRRCFTCTCQA